jgi:hypothetical protein
LGEKLANFSLSKNKKNKKNLYRLLLVTKLGTYGARQTLTFVGSYFSLLID